MRLLIAGGGTGGHLYPGIAVAREWLARGEDQEVLFAGTDRGLEARVLPALGLPLVTVRSAGVVGRGAVGRIRAVGRLSLGLKDAFGLVRRYRPSVCLGVGGYASFPVVLAALLARVPAAVQEQNAWPGLANRVLARWVRRVYAGMGAALEHLPADRTRVTGNPLRPEFREAAPYAPPGPGEPVRLLVVGGSQGARFLNETVPAAVARLARPVSVVHQAGRAETQAVQGRYGDRPGVRVTAYLDDIRAAYAQAHLVVARAGALTVAELAAVGRPAVLVPYPHAAGDHQSANARAAQEAGAARWVPQAGCDAAVLAAVLDALLAAPDRLREMARVAAASAPRDAARTIVGDLMMVASG